LVSHFDLADHVSKWRGLSIQAADRDAADGNSYEYRKYRREMNFHYLPPLLSISNNGSKVTTRQAAQQAAPGGTVLVRYYPEADEGGAVGLSGTCQ
jgi:hypothetical protein